jgi:hypothetical protein
VPQDSEALTPTWWVKRLDKARRERNKRLKTYDKYYRGDHPLLFATEKFLEAFGGLFGEFADNWCDLVVDAVEERLNVEGFRYRAPGQRRSRRENNDNDAWGIWQANNLDSESQMAHTEAILKEEAYTLTWYGDDGEPVITVEDPIQVIVECEPGNRRRRAAALKVWQDDWTSTEMATLYLPDKLYKFQRRSAAGGFSAGGAWEPRKGTDFEVDNPLGVVPVVPLVNRPRLLVAGQSEIVKVIPIQDAVNKLVTDMIVSSEYGAYRQRWATGMDIPVDPVTNQPIEDLKSAASRLWRAEDENTKFGEFEATDLRNFVVAIEMLVQHIASQTRTPPHYFYLKGEFPSGESIKSAETGLVAKARRKTRSFGEGWEETMRLAFKVKGDPRANVTDGETIWADLESRSESEHADAQVKKKDLGVPWEQSMEDLGYSPQQIERMKAMRTEDAALGLTPRPEVPPTGTPSADTADE